MIKSNSMATTVSHAENCIYDIKAEIEKNGSEDQILIMKETLGCLEKLYFVLREEE
jgi:hypothetical protein